MPAFSHGNARDLKRRAWMKAGHKKQAQTMESHVLYTSHVYAVAREREEAVG